MSTPRPQALFPRPREKKCRMKNLGRWRKDARFLRFRCTRHKHPADTDILIHAQQMYHDMNQPWQIPGDGPEFVVVRNFDEGMEW